LITAITTPLLDRIETLEQKLSVRMDHLAREQGKQKLRLGGMEASSKTRDEATTLQIRNLQLSYTSSSRVVRQELEGLRGEVGNINETVGEIHEEVEETKVLISDVLERVEELAEQEDKNWEESREVRSGLLEVTDRVNDHVIASLDTINAKLPETARRLGTAVIGENRRPIGGNRPAGGKVNDWLSKVDC
jgi:chromosome segregation ATPase